MGLLRRRSIQVAPLPVSTYQFSDRLATLNAGLAFEAFVSLEWRRDIAAADGWATPRTAVRVIRRIIEEVAKETSVLRVQAAEEYVDVALRRQLPLRHEGIEVVRATVILKVDQETVSAAKRLERLLHEQELDELAQRQAKGRADFLREVILADPASARLYTMLDLPSRLGGPAKGADLD